MNVIVNTVLILVTLGTKLVEYYDLFHLLQGLQKITTPELSEELPSSRTLVELDVYSNANGGFHNFKQIIDNWITGDQVSVR